MAQPSCVAKAAHAIAAHLAPRPDHGARQPASNGMLKKLLLFKVQGSRLKVQGSLNASPSRTTVPLNPEPRTVNQAAGLFRSLLHAPKIAHHHVGALIKGGHRPENGSLSSSVMGVQQGLSVE